MPRSSSCSSAGGSEARRLELGEATHFLCNIQHQFCQRSGDWRGCDDVGLADRTGDADVELLSAGVPVALTPDVFLHVVQTHEVDVVRFDSPAAEVG